MERYIAVHYPLNYNQVSFRFNITEKQICVIKKKKCIVNLPCGDSPVVRVIMQLRSYKRDTSIVLYWDLISCSFDLRVGQGRILVLVALNRLRKVVPCF